MAVRKMDLAWVVVADISKAKKFFTEVVGLKLVESNDNYGWLEFEGEDGGSRLGVGQYSPEYSPEEKPGMNAVMTMTVEDIEQSRKSMEEKGTRFVGETIEIPGNVKMATFLDSDGNVFQLVQEIKNAHSSGCCC